MSKIDINYNSWLNKHGWLMATLLLFLVLILFVVIFLLVVYCFKIGWNYGLSPALDLKEITFTQSMAILLAINVIGIVLKYET